MYLIAETSPAAAYASSRAWTREGGTTTVNEAPVTVAESGTGADNPGASSDVPQPPGGGRAIRIAVVTHGQASSPFWAIVRNGVEAAGRQMDVVIDYKAPDVYSLEHMESLIDQAVAARPGDPGRVDRVWLSALVKPAPRGPAPDPVREPEAYERWSCTAYPANVARDLTEHLNRIAGFNRRAEKPTSWELEVHTSDDYFERMLRDKPGNVVVLSGRNRVKMDRILASVKSGLNVLADKPWILQSSDLPKLEAALAEADAKKLVAYDIMTERFEITTILQRALVNDPATFGEQVRGTQADPGVYMESVHHLMKVVAGAPNIRPTWFFDTLEQGEAASDVGSWRGSPNSWSAANVLRSTTVQSRPATASFAIAT